MLIRKVLFITFFIGLFSISCKKDENFVPDVFVDIYIYPTDPTFVNLNAVGGWVYVTGGVRGIIVYRRSNDEFTALERNCTYQPSNNCARVMVDSTNINAVDTCCGSKFQIIDGAVIQGPAVRPLKSYKTTFNGTSLHIFN